MASVAYMYAMFAGQLETSDVDVGVFAQYGVLGVVCLILIVFARGAYQREKDRADKSDEKYEKLNTLVLDRIIPILEMATHSTRESTALLQAIQRERELSAISERQNLQRRETGG